MNGKLGSRSVNSRWGGKCVGGGCGGFGKEFGATVRSWRG